MKKNILEIKNLILSFEDPTSGKRQKVIRDTGFSLKEGDILGIVGESGSGKTVITSAALGLAGDDARIESGTIKVNGIDVTNFSQKQWTKSKLLGNVISTVFQNPLETLNPNQKISTQLVESIKLRNNKKIKKSLMKSKAMKMLKELNFRYPEEIMEMYPFQLSGGMRQRVVIASALLTNPKILILDEPTTALDPTIEAEIIELIKKVVAKRKLTIIIITHDLSVIASLSKKVAVMYAGKIIEIGNTEEIINFPQHPYTWGLLRSVPTGVTKKEFYSIPGRAPFDLNNIKGDAFASRNEDYLLPIDLKEHPPFFQVSDTHKVATWLLDKKAPLYTPPQEILASWEKWCKKNKIKSSEIPGHKDYKSKLINDGGQYE